MSSPASPSHVLKPSLHCLADALTTVKIFVKDTLEPQSGLTSIPCSQLARTPLSLPPSLSDYPASPAPLPRPITHSDRAYPSLHMRCEPEN